MMGLGSTILPRETLGHQIGAWRARISLSQVYGYRVSLLFESIVWFLEHIDIWADTFFQSLGLDGLNFTGYATL